MTNSEPIIIEQHDYEHNDIMKKYPEFAKDDIYTLDKCSPHSHSSAIKTHNIKQTYTRTN